MLKASFFSASEKNQNLHRYLSLKETNPSINFQKLITLTLLTGDNLEFSDINDMIFCAIEMANYVDNAGQPTFLLRNTFNSNSSAPKENLALKIIYREFDSKDRCDFFESVVPSFDATMLQLTSQKYPQGLLITIGSTDLLECINDSLAVLLALINFNARCTTADDKKHLKKELTLLAERLWLQLISFNPSSHELKTALHQLACTAKLLIKPTEDNLQDSLITLKESLVYVQDILQEKNMPPTCSLKNNEIEKRFYFSSLIKKLFNNTPQEIKSLQPALKNLVATSFLNELT